MKTIKLFIISFSLTFIALVTVTPAIAKPSMNIQHLHVNKAMITTFSGNDAINIARKVSNQYDTSFSTGLILTNKAMLSEEKATVAMQVVNRSNEFFTSTMIVSDKINQFISYLTSPSKEGFTKQNKSTSKSKVIRKKCDSNTPSYS